MWSTLSEENSSVTKRSRAIGRSEPSMLGSPSDRACLVAGVEQQPVGVLDEPGRVGQTGEGVPHPVLRAGGVLRVRGAG